ncbi:transcriptional regulator SdiA [Atlantibacter sp.]|uniref:transcriptional regulator SdiA n=1 Tax=Atlantibacter sp. TaxID=1903473 RepID=UPI0028A0894C|nr:transcriptional regulator SdiA [Atlantibacter sp.]
MTDSDFFNWRKNVFNRFQEAQTSAEVEKLLASETKAMAFEYYALCIRHPVPFTRPKLTIFTTYRSDWTQHYQAENYAAIDPVLNPNNFHRGYLPWNDELFSTVPDFWDAARDYGLKNGVTQTVMAPGRALGFLSTSNLRAQEAWLSDDELALRLYYLAELSMMALLRMNSPAMTGLEMKFSKREREILQWTAEGKTSSEIAMILSISENTVNFHQKNMQKKFNAPNKTQVACYAVAMGLI